MNGDLSEWVQQYSKHVDGICGMYPEINRYRSRAGVIRTTLERTQDNVRGTNESVMEL